MWADMIGFCFDPNHPCYLEPAKAAEIIAWVSGPKICGEFGSQPAEWILDFAERLKLDAVQIPAGHPGAKTLKDAGLKLIISAGQTENMPDAYADLYICHDREVYEKTKQVAGVPVLLETDLTSALDPLPEGIAFRGGDEDRPGTRNHAGWTAFLEKWDD